MSILSVKYNRIILGGSLSLTLFSCTGNHFPTENNGVVGENSVTVPVPVQQPTKRQGDIQGNKLSFVAGEFNNLWTTGDDGADTQWYIEARFPFITDGKLLFLETGELKTKDTEGELQKVGTIQRVSSIKLKKLLNGQNGFLPEDRGYPSREAFVQGDMFDRSEPPKVLAMYRGNAVRAEDREGQRLIALSNEQSIDTSASIRDYLNIHGEEWLVYPKQVVKRDSSDVFDEQRIFQCKGGVFSVDVQQETIAVGYNDLNNDPKVCVWKNDGLSRDCGCQNGIDIDNATNPVLSPAGNFLAVAAYDNERWDLKVGPVSAFPRGPVVENIKFHDIKVKKVFYRNSYAWAGNTLFFTKQNSREPYKLTCQRSGCDNKPQPLKIPDSIMVCGIKEFIPSNQNPEQFLSGLKDNQSLWFHQAATSCSEKYEYRLDELEPIKWGQPFFVGGQAYLAAESLIESVDRYGKWTTITRILIFAIE
jgi:hypothetical protein